MILQLDNVVKSYGDRRAVDGLSFSVAAGEVLALLGPNGAGKTTTVEMCEGFIAPDSGSISVFGLDPMDDSDAVRSRIGVMLQGGGAYPGIRVGEMLKLVASYSSDPLDPNWLLETVGLNNHLRTPYRRLSGGQQQRLSLACALVGRPELVFLDEPTAGLDAQSRLAVWDIIRSLTRDGVGVVLTTHLMDEAEALADKVVIIDNGKVVAEGSPADITSRRSAGGESRIAVTFDAPIAGSDFLAAINRALDAEHEALSLSSDSAAVTGAETLTLSAPEVSPTTLTAIAAAAAAQEVLITSLTVNKQSLEDVFLDITGREMRS